MPARTAVVLAALALLGAPALVACGGSSGASGSGSPVEVAVTAKDDSCEVADTSLDAGRTSFAISNKGSKVTEVYVYAKAGEKFSKVVEEVENIGPGTSRDLAVDLSAGEYELACKPGQQGDGIRTRLTVTGAGSGSTASTAPAHDAEVEVEVTDTAIEGLDAFTARAGQKVEFVLENNGTKARELKVLGPDGAELGEVGDTDPGQRNEAVVTLPTAGTYTVEVPVEGSTGPAPKATVTIS